MYNKYSVYWADGNITSIDCECIDVKDGVFYFWREDEHNAYVIAPAIAIKKVVLEQRG